MFSNPRKQKLFHSKEEEKVRMAVQLGFAETQRAMWYNIGEFPIPALSSVSILMLNDPTVQAISSNCNLFDIIHISLLFRNAWFPRKVVEAPERSLQQHGRLDSQSGGYQGEQSDSGTRRRLDRHAHQERFVPARLSPCLVCTI